MIYILSQFDLEIKQNDNVVDMKSGDICFMSDFIGKLYIFPKDNDVLESYQINCDKKLKTEFYEFWQLAKNDVLLVLKPKVRYSQTYYNEQLLEVGKPQIKIRYFLQDYGLIQIFHNNSKLSNKLTAGAMVNCWTKKFAEKKIAFVEIKNERNYYFIFDETGLLYKGYIKEINQKDGKLILLVDDINLYGQKTVVEVNVKTRDIESYLVYYDQRSLVANIDIKYLFLDAIMLQNKEVACQYLSSELNKIDFEIFVAFFEEFDDYIFIENNCIILKNTEVIKIVYFDIQNNLIVNIYD